MGIYIGSSYALGEDLVKRPCVLLIKECGKHIKVINNKKTILRVSLLKGDSATTI